jgi:osmoprotectant transport system ATP-binding protein
MIDLRDVEKVYSGGHVALRGLTLSIRTAETMALLGPSGSGKTTALKLINRLIAPSSGEVLIDGVDVSALDPIALRRGIGYAVQEGALFPHRSAVENVATVPRLLGWPAERTRARCRELFDLVGLEFGQFAERYPAELSGGQRQRVGLARAIAADPPILLMDEPFSALDPLNRRRLQEEFRELQRRLKKTVVFVTHDVQEAFGLADTVAIIWNGEAVQCGTPRELVAEPASELVARFLRPAPDPLTADG